MCKWIIDNLEWICPLIITILFSLLNIIVAIGNLKIVKHQKQMQNDEFCFQLFEKRWEVYTALNEVFEKIGSTGKATQDNIIQFKAQLQPARFLFGADMIGACEAALQLIIELATVGKQVQYNIDHGKNNPNHDALCDRECELLIQMSKHQERLADIASRYISFANCRTTNSQKNN